MAVLKRRSKMISVRLSEQEYQSLMALCAERGSRSLSDLARDAMYRLLGDGNGSEHGRESGLDQLHGRLMELEGEVKRLAQTMARAATQGGVR